MMRKASASRVRSVRAKAAVSCSWKRIASQARSKATLMASAVAASKGANLSAGRMLRISAPLRRGREPLRWLGYFDQQRGTLRLKLGRRLRGRWQRMRPPTEAAPSRLADYPPLPGKLTVVVVVQL